jgi:aspartate/methionine/tyrosine aminotransferase
MKPYAHLNAEQLLALKNGLDEDFLKHKEKNKKLNMTRGVPSQDQLNLCNEMLTCLSSEDFYAANGSDCRNYGGLDGIPEIKKIFADLLGLTPDEVVVGGNSSLALMFDNVSVNMSHGVREGKPWQSQGKVKFLCPSPGYDHFTICKYFNIEMIPVSTNSYGPDMDFIEKLVSSDPMIKGIWCVPKFSNPSGIVYSEETVKRFAALKPAAEDFRIYWDNAYAFHDLDSPKITIPNIIRLCKEAGNPQMVYVFTSFSKVSFAGCAVACVASSISNIEYIKKRLTAQTIGHDKINQLRHVRFFKDAGGVLSHMEKHAEILRPKFKLVSDTLNEKLNGLEIAKWTEPKGGYFVSFDALNGCAKRIVELCSGAGVALTPAGATYPYGNDPNDSNIRIAPSFPPLNELKEAMEIFCTAAKLASVEKLLAET